MCEKPANIDIVRIDTATDDTWRAVLRDHLRRLGFESRRLRFLSVASDRTIDAYVAGAHPAHVLLAQEQGVVHGCAEVHFVVEGAETYAEIAVSVDEPYQNHGIGTLLLEHCNAVCQEAGIDEMRLFYDPHNLRMDKIARHMHGEDIWTADPGIHASRLATHAA